MLALVCRASVQFVETVEKVPCCEMKENLYQLANEYVDLIEKIERTSDPIKLQSLEEKRVDLHWKFIGMLNKQGIKFKDRDHATRIALRIVKEEF